MYRYETGQNTTVIYAPLDLMRQEICVWSEKGRDPSLGEDIHQGPMALGWAEGCQTDLAALQNPFWKLHGKIRTVSELLS